jgi:hypothetical protein
MYGSHMQKVARNKVNQNPMSSSSIHLDALEEAYNWTMSQFDLVTNISIKLGRKKYVHHLISLLLQEVKIEVLKDSKLVEFTRKVFEKAATESDCSKDLLEEYAKFEQAVGNHKAADHIYWRASKY